MVSYKGPFCRGASAEQPHLQHTQSAGRAYPPFAHSLRVGQGVEAHVNALRYGRPHRHYLV